MTAARSRFESISGILTPRQPVANERAAGDEVSAPEPELNRANSRKPSEATGVRHASEAPTRGQRQTEDSPHAANNTATANAELPTAQKKTRRTGQNAAAPEAKPGDSRPRQRQRRVKATDDLQVRERSAAPSRDSDPAAEQTPAGASRRVAFRLQPELHAALSARTRESDSSRADVVLDLVEKAVIAGRLQAIVNNYASPHEHSGGLFPRLQGRRPAEPAIPTEIRVAPEAVQILDELVERHGALSRTHLLSAVVADAFTS